MLRRTLLQGLPRRPDGAACSPVAAWPGAGQRRPAIPDQPVTIIVPFAAGGNTDAFARMVGEELDRRWASASSSTTRPAPAAISAWAARPRGARTATRWAWARSAPTRSTHALQEAALRSGYGLRADLAVRDAAQRPGRQSERRGEDGPGADRAAEGQARHLHFRLLGYRHLDRISPVSCSWPRPAPR